MNYVKTIKIQTTLSLLLVSQLIVESEALAINKRQVCANGNVQYTPCPEGKTTQETKISYQKKLPRKASRGPASISKTSFSKIKGNQGLWKGFLKAHGEVHLRLHILKDGIQTDSRYMGSVQVSENEKPTKFMFRSPVPKGSNWSWYIESEVYG